MDGWMDGSLGALVSVVLARLDTRTFDLDHVPRAIQLRARVDEFTIPIGSIAVPFCGSYLGSYKAILRRNYNAAES